MWTGSLVLLWAIALSSRQGALWLLGSELIVWTGGFVLLGVGVVWTGRFVFLGLRVCLGLRACLVDRNLPWGQEVLRLLVGRRLRPSVVGKSYRQKGRLQTLRFLGKKEMLLGKSSKALIGAHFAGSLKLPPKL